MADGDQNIAQTDPAESGELANLRAPVAPENPDPPAAVKDDAPPAPQPSSQELPSEFVQDTNVSLLPPNPSGTLAGAAVAADRLYRRPGRVMNKVARQFEAQLKDDIKTAAKVAEAGKRAETDKAVSDAVKSVRENNAKTLKSSETAQEKAVQAGSKDVARDLVKGDKDIKAAAADYEKGAAKAEKKFTVSTRKAEEVTAKASKEFDGSVKEYEGLMKKAGRSGAKPADVVQIKYVINEASKNVREVKGTVLTNSSKFTGNMQAGGELVKDGAKATKAFGVVSKVARGAEIVGVAYAGYEIYSAAKTGDKKQVAAATGDAVGGLAGAFVAGSLTGAAIGAFGAGIGAVPGYVIGGVVGVGGALLGGWGGRQIAAWGFGAPDESPEIQAQNLKKAQDAVAKYKLPGSLSELYYLDDQARKKGYDDFPHMYESLTKNDRPLPAPDQIAHNLGYKNPVTVTPPVPAQMAAQLSGTHIVTGTTITLSPELLARGGTNDNRPVQIQSAVQAPASMPVSALAWDSTALQAKILQVNPDADIKSKIRDPQNPDRQLPDGFFESKSLEALNNIRADQKLLPLKSVAEIDDKVVAQLDQQIAALQAQKPQTELAGTYYAPKISAGALTGNAYRDILPSGPAEPAPSSQLTRNFAPNYHSLKGTFADPSKAPEQAKNTDPVLKAGPDNAKKAPLDNRTTGGISAPV